MTYAYKILPDSLHVTADAAIAWLIHNWGLSKSGIDVEASIDPDISFRPTFVARTRDFHLLCVEVSETIYKNALDSFILDCQKKGLPVKLVVAVPRDVQESEYSKKLKQAKRAGAGLLEVDHQSGTLVERPLALSLASLRPIALNAFPKKLRESLQTAEQTFRDGEPVKACGSVYDELEAVFRVFAKKCQAKGVWTGPSSMNIDTCPWAGLVTSIQNGLDRRNPIVRPINAALLARLHGITSYRNDTGHKPKNQRDRMKRDQALRTRFEGAVDLLREFLDATKGFKV